MAEEMTPEKVVERIENSIAEKMQGTASKEEIEGLKNDLAELKTSVEDREETDAIKSVIAGLEAKFDAMKESADSQKRVALGIKAAIMKAYEDNIDAIKSIKQKGGVIDLDVKVAGDMTIDGNYSGGTVGLSTLETGLARVQRRRPFMREIVNSAGITSKYAVWIEQANPDPNDAGMVAEGVAKAQSDFDLVEASSQVKKVATWIKVSKEMVDDIPFMRGEINNELLELVQLKLDEQILLGDGTGDNLTGLDTFTTAFTPAAQFVNTIPQANNSDVLRVAMAQIENANFTPNYILLNPDDAAAMELTKTTVGEYTYPMFVPQADGITRVKGVPVIVNPGVPTGDYYIGDFTKANLRMREDLNIQVGYINDDFTRNMMTVLCEARACFFVKSNHTAAFVKGDFATDKAALLAP
jgi:HK97 family phage major capsid protein